MTDERNLSKKSDAWFRYRNAARWRSEQVNSLLKRLDSKIMQEKSLTWLATGKYQTTGIHTEILKDLASKAVEGDSRCAVLVFDEIKIKEDLVYCASKPEHSIFDNLEILPGSPIKSFFGDQRSRCQHPSHPRPSH